VDATSTDHTLRLWGVGSRATVKKNESLGGRPSTSRPSARRGSPDPAATASDQSGSPDPAATADRRSRSSEPSPGFARPSVSQRVGSGDSRPAGDTRAQRGPFHGNDLWSRSVKPVQPSEKIGLVIKRLVSLIFLRSGCRDSPRWRERRRCPWVMIRQPNFRISSTA
jgi:hypothetical protein